LTPVQGLKITFVAVLSILIAGCLLTANAWPPGEFLPTGIELSLIWGGLLPAWLHLLALALLLLVLWRSLRRRRLALRLGICLLATGVYLGLLLPATGRAQPALTNLLTVIATWEEHYPHKDAAVLQLDCSWQASGAPRGVTAILHNPQAQPEQYKLTHLPFDRWWSYLYLHYSPRREPWPDKGQTFALAPGETLRHTFPWSAAMLGAQVYVRATPRDPARPFVAFCNLWWANRTFLYTLGALCGLAGLICLGVAWVQGRTPVS
jgi:hypothetical protein